MYYIQPFDKKLQVIFANSSVGKIQFTPQCTKDFSKCEYYTSYGKFVWILLFHWGIREYYSSYEPIFLMDIEIAQIFSLSLLAEISIHVLNLSQ